MRRSLGVVCLLAVVCLASYDPLSTSGEWLINAYKAALSPLQGRNMCNFWPTCSQFTREAIRTRGFFEGVVVGADRLMRCSPAAWSYAGLHYHGITNSRLNDPVANHLIATACWQSQPESAERRAGSLACEAGPTGQDAALGFAEFLHRSGDYTRAANEYLRCAWAGSNPAYARLMAGESFLLAGEYDRARTAFFTSGFADFAAYGAGRAWFAQEKYDSTRTVLAQIRDTTLTQKARALSGWSFYRERRFREAARLFGPDTPFAAMNGSDISRRSRLGSTLLAAVLPGAGHVYAARTADGVYTLLTVASSALVTWYFLDNPQKDRTRIKVSLFGSLTALFYVANLYGANIAARDYNRLQETRYVSRVERVFNELDLAPDYAEARNPQQDTVRIGTPDEETPREH